MPDCSAVTITVNPELTGHNPERVTQWLERAADMYSADHHTDTTIAWYEAAWGDNDENVTATIDRMVRAGLSFIVHDAGHYTWDASETGWHPDLGIRQQETGDCANCGVGSWAHPTEETRPRYDACETYVPAMKDVPDMRYRPAGIEGQPLLSKEQVEAALSASGGSVGVGKRLLAHFGDDPREWIAT